MSELFNKLWDECENEPEAQIAFAAVWVYKDGRCMGMTGESHHRLSGIPEGFTKDEYGLGDGVDIFTLRVSRK